MARIRTIKPEFFTSEDIVALKPLARLLYVALWCEADREGRMLWKPRTFKLRYFPGDSIDLEPIAQALIDAGLVVIYGGGKYAYIPKFSTHQHINPREAQSVIPACDEFSDIDACARVDDASLRASDAQVGREGKGKEGVLRVTRDAPSFESFWAAYPRKVAKPQAEKAWRKLDPDTQTLEAIIAAIQRDGRSDQWLRDGGQFIPYPATWLNGRRWEDQAAQSPGTDLDAWMTRMGVSDESH